LEAKNKIEADDRLKDFVDNICVKTTLTLWVTLEFHNAKVISMSVYSDLDAMDEGKFFAKFHLLKNQLIWLLRTKK
jgi:hypothetical protein